MTDAQFYGWARDDVDLLNEPKTPPKTDTWLYVRRMRLRSYTIDERVLKPGTWVTRRVNYKTTWELP